MPISVDDTAAFEAFWREDRRVCVAIGEVTGIAFVKAFFAAFAPNYPGAFADYTKALATAKRPALMRRASDT